MRVTDALDPARVDFGACDAVCVLHVRDGARLLRAAQACEPRPFVIGAIAGTDLYVEPGIDAALIEGCDRVVVLQPAAIERLPEAVRARARVIRQSATAPAPRPAADPDVFAVCVLAHLRPVKDPFVVAEATLHLPDESRIAVRHAGAALVEEDRARAEALARELPRWTWLGPLPRREAAELLGRSRVCVVPSLAEGGAGVVSEAVAHGVAIVASRVDGNVGLLGADHPGLFPVGDARALAALLARAEREPAFLAGLEASSRALRPAFAPAVEREAWRALLAELDGVSA